VKKVSVPVGVIGHVDHGKTSLVRALTGIDTDRLAEEKRRGVSIVPGFAFFETDRYCFDLIDVPGHADYLHNALRSLFSIRMALLVVSANEGVKPQTIEHLEIAAALGIKNLIVALTKCDLVESATIPARAEEIRNRAARPGFENPTVQPVSSVTGQGLSDLTRAFESVASQLEHRGPVRAFRFPVDRVFSLPGAGTVVTGCVCDGSVSEKEHLVVYPAELPCEVRSIERHGTQVPTADALERAGLALKVNGPVRRGDVLARPGTVAPSRMLNVELRVFDSAPRALYQNERVYVHHLSRETTGKLVLSGKNEAGPGDTCICQVRLDDYLAAFYDDVLIFRMMNPPGLAAFGRVIDTHPPKLRRGKIRFFQTLGQFLASDGRYVLIPLARAKTLTVRELSAQTGLVREEIEARIAREEAEGRIVRIGERTMLTSTLEAEVQRLSEALTALTSRATCLPVMRTNELMSRLSLSYKPDVFRHIMALLEEKGLVVCQGDRIRIKGAQESLTRREMRIWESVRACLAGCGPVRKAVLLSLEGHDPREVQAVLQKKIADGTVVRFRDDAFILTTEFEAAVDMVLSFIQSHGSIHVVEAKQILPWGRRATVSFLDHCDRVGLTVRIGDRHYGGTRSDVADARRNA